MLIYSPTCLASALKGTPNLCVVCVYRKVNERNRSVFTLRKVGSHRECEHTVPLDLHTNHTTLSTYNVLPKATLQFTTFECGGMNGKIVKGLKRMIVHTHTIVVSIRTCFLLSQHICVTLQ